MERVKPTEVSFNGTKVVVVLGDIVEQEVDAVVNAANERLKGGSGVDWAIHNAAGWDQLQAACREIGFCRTDDAVITPGFNLRARFIIHTVGPVYAAGPVNEAGKKYNEEARELLASCYRRSLEIAAQNGVRTIAFPAISTGMFEYPADRATDVAMNAVKNFVLENPGVFDEIKFVMFDDDYHAIAKRRLTEHFK